MKSMQTDVMKLMMLISIFTTNVVFGAAPAPANLHDASVQETAVVLRKLQEKFEGLNTRVADLMFVPFVRAEKAQLCFNCKVNNKMLFRIVCSGENSWFHGQDKGLCLSCIEQFTIKDIFKVSIIVSDATQAASVKLSVKLPACPCGVPYYNESNFSALKQALTTKKCCALVVQALVEKLGKISKTDISMLVAQLSVIYGGIITCNSAGEVLSPELIALQIVERDAGIQAEIATFCADVNTLHR